MLSKNRRTFESLLCLCLISDSLHSLLELLLIEKVVVFKRGKVAIEFENERASSWDIVADDVSIRHLGEMLHDSAKGISMSGYDDSLAIKDLRADLIVPVGKNTINCDLEGLCCRKDILSKACIARIKLRVALVIEGKLRRRNIEAASP